jgi:endonuclease IV
MILETPCGNKNELLSNPEEFGEFVSLFPLQKLRVCLDTCHVFVSGYLPMTYIKLLSHTLDRICLIHFNGTHKKQGCKADGHAPIYMIQNIPDHELVQVLQTAEKHNIACITE